MLYTTVKKNVNLLMWWLTRSTESSYHQGIDRDSFYKEKTRTPPLSSATIQIRYERKKRKHTTTALVVNPTSAGGSTGKVWDTQFIKIRKVFGQNPEIVFTKKGVMIPIMYISQ